MKLRVTKILTLLLAVVIVFSALYLPAVAETAQPTSYSKDANSGTRDVVCTSLSGTSASSYYTGSYTYEKLSMLSASSLKTSLNSLMKSTHSKISSYDDCHYKADMTDCENGNGKVTLIYTSYQATMSQWNGWNREHVWPQSLGGGNTTGGGADLHHVRPSDSGVNSSRGNKKYGNAGSGASEKYGSDPAVGVLGGTYNNTYFEPLDNVKGDVARICLYVYVRWGSDWGADSITKVFQSVDVLLEWCEMDPVDTWEMGRNEVVQNIQGNRNVFIDYPEYAWLLFGEDIPEDMPTPSGMAMGESGGAVAPPEETDPDDAPGGSGGNTPTDPDDGTGEAPSLPEWGSGESGVVSNNIYYGDTLNFMFASTNKPSVTYTNSKGQTVSIDVDPFKIDGEQVIVNGYPAWISRSGVPAQNIGMRINVEVDGMVETYSVLEYIYTRLYVSENVDPAEKTMHERLIKYAKLADVVINGVETSEIGTEYLVKFTNGTIDGSTSSDLFKLNDAPFANVSAYGDFAGAEILWEVRVTVDGVTTTKTYTDEELKKLKITGHTVVTAVEKEQENPPATDPVWQLVTDASQLSVGDKIIIVACDDNCALSTTQNKNNRGYASITKDGNTIVSPSEAVQIITLETGAKQGTFALSTETGYLYAASSSSNYLKTKSSLDDSGSWKITVSTSGVATIVSQGTYTRNTLRYNYNSGSSLFSCYDSNTTNTKNVSIYVLK